MSKPRKPPAQKILGNLVEVLRGRGYRSVDEQARILSECAVLLASIAGVMAAMDGQGKLHPVRGLDDEQA